MKCALLNLFFTGLLAVCGTKALAFQNETNPLAATVLLNPSQMDLNQNAELKVKINLLPGFHVYEESLQVNVIQPEGFLLSKPNIEPVVEFYDKNSRKTRRGVENDASITSVIEAPHQWRKNPPGQLKIELTYQACTETFCLFPKTITLDLPNSIIQPVQKSTWSGYLSSKNSMIEVLQTHFWLGLLLVFFGGILTSFSPCIFPMIPITIAVLGHRAQTRTRLQNFITSVFYVLGIALTYSLLGLFVASTGALFGSTLSSPFVLGTICAILLLMALSQFGWFEIKTPSFISQSVSKTKTNQNYVGAFISGLISGVVASPCVGPVLVALLSYVVTLNSPILGFVYLFVYALGMGLIFLALGLSNQLLTKLPTSGPWLDAVKNALGLLLLGGFYYYLHLLLPENWYFLTLGLGLVLVALQFGALLGWQHLKLKEKITKSAMLALMAIGFVIMADNAFKTNIHTLAGDNPESQTQQTSSEGAWVELTEDSLKSALSNGKPTMVDFWASWCEACIKLKNGPFKEKAVLQRFEGYNLLHFDATKDSPALKKFRDQFDINGLPHIMFFDRTGKQRDDLLLSEFEKSEKLLKRLDALEK